MDGRRDGRTDRMKRKTYDNLRPNERYKYRSKDRIRYRDLITNRTHRNSEHKDRKIEHTET